MIKKGVLKSAFLLILVLGALFIFLNQEKRDSNNLSDGVRVDKIHELERKIIDSSWEELDFSVINDSLLNPVHLRVWENSLYVMDYADLKIKKFDLSNFEMKEIGNGRGRGPGEFLTFTDMSFDHDKIWISDVNKREVQAFDTNGNYLNGFIIKNSAYRISATNNVISILVMGDSLLIHQYDREGNLQRTFGKVIDNQYKNTMSLSGRLISAEKNGEIIYAPLKASYLFYFDNKGKLKRTVQTLDKIDFPSVNPEILSDGTLRAKAPSMVHELTDIQTHQDTLILKTFNNGVKGPQRTDYLDFYSASGEEYYHSVNVPLVAHSFAKKGNTYFFIEIGSQVVRAFRVNKN